MVRPAREIRQGLVGKFGFTRIEGSRHEKYRLEVDGVWKTHTVMSRGVREVSDVIFGQMARQIGVTAKQFRMMLDCSISRDEYLELVDD